MLTQRELADRAGLSRSYIGALETGKSVAGLPALRKLAEVLNVGREDLTG